MDIWKSCKSFPGFIVNQEGLLMNELTGRILGNSRNHKGCPTYCGKRISHYVADAWLGKRKPGFEIRHKNHNKMDNRPENLVYMLKPVKHKTFVQKPVTQKNFTESYKFTEGYNFTVGFD